MDVSGLAGAGEGALAGGSVGAGGVWGRTFVSGILGSSARVSSFFGFSEDAALSGTHDFCSTLGFAWATTVGEASGFTGSMGSGTGSGSGSHTLLEWARSLMMGGCAGGEGGGSCHCGG